MGKCVVIGAAEIKNYRRTKEYLAKDDFFIFCDGGLVHAESLGVKPSLIIGDFDSYTREKAAADNTDNVEMMVLPCEKDDTDTVFAVKEGIKRGFSEFLLLGAIGQRLDHSLANVSILVMLNGAGKSGLILDDYSEIRLVGRETAYIDDKFSYFSLLNITGKAEGITIRNAKYPLENGRIDCEYQYGISNEVLAGEQAAVSVAEGQLLLIKVF